MNKTELQAYKDQLREGLTAYTEKAFRMLPEMKNPCILDIGCGSGVPTLELARLSDGKITAIDIDHAELDRLSAKIKQAGLAARVKAEQRSMLNLDFPDDSFDIIWTEGSIAVIGFEKGLKDWRRLLKTGGFLVVHDDLGDIIEKRAQISRCGYELINHFVLGNDVWWNEYYAPLEEKINEFLVKPHAGGKKFAFLDDDRNEIEGFRKDPERYQSVVFVMRKS